MGSEYKTEQEASRTVGFGNGHLKRHQGVNFGLVSHNTLVLLPSRHRKSIALGTLEYPRKRLGGLVPNQVLSSAALHI